MRTLFAIPAILAIAAATMAQVRPAAPAVGQTVTIAVVRDGAMPEDISTGIEAELRQVAARGTELSFVRTSELDAQWAPERARQALQAALDDPEVDYILAVGALVSHAASEIALTKPVVATFVQRPDFGAFHSAVEDRSQTENLAFLQLALLVETDFAAMEEIVPFPKAAHLLLPESYVGVSDLFGAEVRAIEQTIGARIELVPVGDSPSDAVASLPPEAVVAFVAATPRWTPSQRQQLFEALTERGVASYGLVGHTDVEAGALAGRAPDLAQLVARRSALNLNELMRGSSITELPVLLEADPQPLINGRTAQALNYVPTYETLVTAQFLHQDALRQNEPSLSFPEALEQADKGNAFLRVSEQAVETSYHAWKRAKAPLLPQAYAGLDTSGRNVRGLEGFIPDKIMNGGVSVRQMIYDDASVTDYKSEGRLYEGNQQGLEVDRLDVYADAGSAYLNLVLVEILFKVDASNLQLTRDNLELAKVRESAGYSGRDEVFRWESEVNSRQSILINSRAGIETELIALNQILGLEQYSRWRPEEIPVDPRVFPFLGGGLSGYLSDPQKMERFREFLVRLGLRSAPELFFLAKSLEAQQLQLGQRKRRWYLPVFDTGFRWGYDIWRTPDLPEVGRTDWLWDVQAVYPIFEGGFRAADERVNASELARLEKEVVEVHQVIERRVRTAIRAVEGSFPSITYLNAAAEASRRNFEIVRDRYTEGLVNVTDLLDAQNDRFNTERTAQAQQYAFLLDMVALQRAIAWFEDLKTPEEAEQLLAEARRFIENPTPPESGPPEGGQDASLFQRSERVGPIVFGPNRALTEETRSSFTGRKP